jgi:hypothetical protein
MHKSCQYIIDRQAGHYMFRPTNQKKIETPINRGIIFFADTPMQLKEYSKNKFPIYLERKIVWHVET